MNSSQECMAQARRCLRHAEDTALPNVRRSFLAAAERWIWLAGWSRRVEARRDRLSSKSR